MNNKLKGFIAILLSAILLGIFPTFMRILDTMYGEYSQILFRGLVGLVVLIIIILIKREKLFVARKDRMSLLLFIITIPLTSFLLVFSILMIKTSTAVFMLYAGSLLIAFIIGTFIFKENVSKTKIISLIAVIVGLLVFTFPIDNSSILGMILGFTGGAIEGLSNALRKKLGSIPRETTLFYQFIITIIFSAIAVAITNEVIIKEISILAILVTIAFGFLLVVLGYLMLFGFKHFDANIGTTVLSSEMFFSVIFALIFLAETPTSQEIIGGVLIFLGANIPHIYQFIIPYLHISNNKV